MWILWKGKSGCSVCHYRIHARTFRFSSREVDYRVPITERALCSYFLFNPTPQFHLPPRPVLLNLGPGKSKLRVTLYGVRLECAQKSLNARETAASQPSRSLTRTQIQTPFQLPRRRWSRAREIREFRDKNPKAQPASQALIIALMSLSLSLSLYSPQRKSPSKHKNEDGR